MITDSDNCDGAPPALKIEVTSQLPANHGTTVNYRCAKRYTIRGEKVDAVCEDGTVSFSGKPTPCFPIGRESKILFFFSSTTLKCKIFFV